MKKLILSILVLLALTGCKIQVKGDFVNFAYEYCADKGKIQYFYASPETESTYVKCHDNSVFYQIDLKR